MVDNAWRRVAALSFGVFIGASVTGCDEPVDEDGLAIEEEDRGRGAEAIDERAGGSCVGYCGAMAPTGCWCDSACAQYGDCCADKVDVCDGPPDDPPPDDPPPDDPPDEGDVPDNAYCDAVSEWSAGARAFEEEVVTLVNARRAAGATCGGTPYGPAGALVMNPALRCAGRKHDVDMITNNFFSHTGTGGTTPWQRIASAGYGSYVTAGENIAAGQSTPAAVVTGWMNSPGHCTNIMNAAFEEIGVGYATGGAYGHYWTQTFATQ